MQLALEQNFRRMDELLESAEGNKELLEIRRNGSGESVSSNAGK